LPQFDPRNLVLGTEILFLHAAPVYHGLGVPRGDNSGVVLIPGFLGTDLHLVEMSGWLRRIGYRPYLSGIGLNADCPNLLIRDQLKQIVAKARQETQGKVHLIGHSLGGMIARSLAAQMPACVASVTTLGSPLRSAIIRSNLMHIAEVVRRHILTERGPDVLEECYTGQCSCDFVQYLRRDLPSSIPQTIIYTRTDEVVDWRCCIAENPQLNFEVPGTHVGLPFNPAVYRIVARRLAETQRNLRAPRRRNRELRHAAPSANPAQDL
jgi:triacylglycerol lipase